MINSLRLAEFVQQLNPSCSFFFKIVSFPKKVLWYSAYACYGILACKDRLSLVSSNSFVILNCEVVQCLLDETIDLKSTAFNANILSLRLKYSTVCDFLNIKRCFKSEGLAGKGTID